MYFSEIIKELCKEHGIKVSHLEKELGFSNGYISSLRDKMPSDRAVMVAEYFNLPSDYFFKPTKKGSAMQNPLIEQIISKASTLSDKELEELLSFAGYIQSKH